MDLMPVAEHIFEWGRGQLWPWMPSPAFLPAAIILIITMSSCGSLWPKEWHILGKPLRRFTSIHPLSFLQHLRNCLEMGGRGLPLIGIFTRIGSDKAI